MFCHLDAKKALELARNPVNHYLRSLATAASGWAGKSSTDYPGYQQMLETLEREHQEVEPPLDAPKRGAR